MNNSLQNIIDRSKESGKPFWQIVLEDDCIEQGITREESMARMQTMLDAMRQSDAAYDPELKSSSGLVGTDAARMMQRCESGEMLTGPLMSSVMIKALKVAESNACMKRIVAAPTAGSCGVLPAVLLSVAEHRNLSDEDLLPALYTAAGIGEVIAARACLAGAEGGCQAEIGSASAMAAGGLTCILGGDADRIAQAAAMALGNLLGLVCDPVAGLVEVPCVKRNVIGAVNAVSCADMAIAGITSRIPPDEVIDAMRSVGRAMTEDLRETGRGGLAGTPTGVRIRETILVN